MRVFYLIMKKCLLEVYFVLGKWMDWFLKWYRRCGIGKMDGLILIVVLRVFYLIMKECLLGVYFVLGKWMDWFLKWYRGCGIGKWWWYDFSSGFGDFGWWGGFLSGFGGFLLEGSFFPVVFGFFDGKKKLRSKPPLVYI